MSRQIFTNRNGNTLIKEFEGLFEHNPNIKYLDSVVGFLRASGYFTLRPFLNNIDKVRILIGIDVDEYIVHAVNEGNVFFEAAEEVKQDYLEELRKDIETSNYSKDVDDTSALESEIDRMVYELYGLTEEEIAIVEGKE